MNPRSVSQFDDPSLAGQFKAQKYEMRAGSDFPLASRTAGQTGEALKRDVRNTAAQIQGFEEAAERSRASGYRTSIPELANAMRSVQALQSACVISDAEFSAWVKALWAHFRNSAGVELLACGTCNMWGPNARGKPRKRRKT